MGAIVRDDTIYNMKEAKLKEIKSKVKEWGFTVVDEDLAKPWGGYFVIDPGETERFIESYFSEHKDKFSNSKELSPKFLILEPGKQFSWQVHDRRAEIWRAVEGRLGAYINDNDELPETHLEFKDGDVLFMEQGMRHRLRGLDEWGVVAEIWVHVDEEQLSDEDDIRRIMDDFGR